MSIIKARYRGREVYACKELKQKVVECIYCGCKMYARSFHNSDDCYFVCRAGEEHKNSICSSHESREKNIPILPPTPEQFILKLLRPEKEGGNTTKGTPRVVGPRTPKPETDGLGPISRIGSLTQLLSSGIFFEDAKAPVCAGAECRFIDVIILRKWANIIWNSGNLEPIGLRVIEALWVGNLIVSKGDPQKQANWEGKMARYFNDSKELWLTLHVNVNGKAKYIRLCLDCKSCFATIKNKLFIAGETTNGKYSTYIPRESQIEVFVAGNWVVMGKKDCRAKCPMHFCDGCIGTYWAKCNSGKQIALLKDKYNGKKEK